MPGPNSNTGASQQQVLGLLGLGTNPNPNAGTGPVSNTGGPSQGPMSLMGSGAGPVSSGGGGNGPVGMISGLLNNFIRWHRVLNKRPLSTLPFLFFRNYCLNVVYWYD